MTAKDSSEKRKVVRLFNILSLQENRFRKLLVELLIDVSVIDALNLGHDPSLVPHHSLESDSDNKAIRCLNGLVKFDLLSCLGGNKNLDRIFGSSGLGN